MKKLVISGVVILAIMTLGCAGCSVLFNRIATYTEADTSIITGINQEFVIALQNPTPRVGNHWEESHDNTMLSLINTEYAPDDKSHPDFGGTQNYRFRPLKEGKTEVTFTYKTATDRIIRQKVFSIDISSSEPPPPPAPELTLVQPPSLPTEDAIMEMSTVGTMSGMVKHLIISENGSIVYIEETGPRIVLPGSSRNRITKTGQLTEAELNGLLDMVDACPFDSDGKCNAHTGTTDTDVSSKLYVHFQGTTRTIIADYQPLYPKVTELPDVPEPVRTLYHELWYIVENRTAEVAREKITTGE